MKKALNILKRIGLSIVIPIAVYAFFWIVCNVSGHAGFGGMTDLKTILYSATYAGLIALAMSLNLTSGRFDFSVGATLVLAGITGGNFAYNHNLGAIGLLICVVVCGAVLGAVSGLTYVLLGLPPMVVSLGLAMIYEALAFSQNKSNGLRLMGKTKYLIYSKGLGLYLVLAVVIIVITIVWHYTKFGYERAALASGQKISNDVGINEKRNVIICYILAGMLLGVAACVYVSKQGVISVSMGLSSSSYFMSAFLPLFLGGLIGRFSNHPIGIFLGAITQAEITQGLTWLGCSSSAISVINGVIVMIFLIYTSNAYKLEEAKLFKEKLQKAKAEQAETN